MITKRIRRKRNSKKQNITKTNNVSVFEEPTVEWLWTEEGWRDLTI